MDPYRVMRFLLKLREISGPQLDNPTPFQSKHKNEFFRYMAMLKIHGIH